MGVIWMQILMISVFFRIIEMATVAFDFPLLFGTRS
jgi:hypothetical protein